MRDTRNLLLLRPEIPQGVDAESFLASIGYALQRGLQELYNIEEREIAADRIGQDDYRQVLLWEQAEGGTGVWPRLIAEDDAIAQVAREALLICHFDPDTGDELDGACSRGCYRCLLSYTNQRDHLLLNRQLIRDFLLQLAGSKTQAATAPRDRDAQFAWLSERVDQRSDLEKAFLRALYNTGRKLPDRTQYRPEPGIYAEADFYYDRSGRPGACVFCDGAPHDVRERAQNDEVERGKLADLGYRVIVIRYDEGMEEQLGRYQDVFGEGRR